MTNQRNIHFYQYTCPSSPTLSESSSRHLCDSPDAASDYIRAPDLEHGLSEETLHERIGGDEAVKKITDTFYDIAEKNDSLR